MELEIKHLWYGWLFSLIFTVLGILAGYVWQSVFLLMLFATLNLVVDIAVIILVCLWWKENWR